MQSKRVWIKDLLILTASVVPSFEGVSEWMGCGGPSLSYICVLVRMMGEGVGTASTKIREVVGSLTALILPLHPC